VEEKGGGVSDPASLEEKKAEGFAERLERPRRGHKKIGTFPPPQKGNAPFPTEGRRGNAAAANAFFKDALRRDKFL